MQHRGRSGMNPAWLLCLVLAAVPAAAAPAIPAPPAVATPVAAPIERDPLELRGLLEPEAVLREVVPALRDAQLADDAHRVALLQLARANACRVLADWECQREAGAAAQQAARTAGAVHLQVRGLINEGRARAAMQDFTRGERLFGDAELLLRDAPQAELLADVYLAYSSMSNSLGKHQLAAEYADRGLALLGPEEGLVIRARLFRNKARSLAFLGQLDAAAAALVEARRLAERLDDPKLQAELYLESARIARVAGDIPAQREHGQRVLELAGRLRNSQLSGLGHEVLGLAAADAGQPVEAERAMEAALASFRRLELSADELRVLRELIGILLRHDRNHSSLPEHFQRILVLDAQLEQLERAQAADDFDARLAYAAREGEVARLKMEGDLAQERETSLARANRLNQVLLLMGLAVLGVLAAFYLLQRRSNRRLQAVMATLAARELQYRTLAENASDLVVRMRPDGARTYVSPSVTDLLGYSPEEFIGPRWDLMHPDDVPAVREAIDRILVGGGPITVTYRIRHKRGHLVWLEALGRRVAGEGGQVEIVYSGRDVSARIQTEHALSSARARLHAVSENIPAVLLHVDSTEHVTFSNSHADRLLGGGEPLVGRHLREACGVHYAVIAPHAARALAGEPVRFEGDADLGGRQGDHQANFVPELGADGQVRGFYAFIFDITRIKEAERAMERLARHDGLTGLYNRMAFDERLPPALARARRAGAPVALLYLDLDRFKAVNDTLGHAAGDEVLREFARRLRACVREGDLVARLGGDEFAVLVEGAGPLASAEAIAGKLLREMARPFALAGGPREVAASIGIGYAAQDAGPEALMAAADRALYAAKSGGRATWRVIETG